MKVTSVAVFIGLALALFAGDLLLAPIAMYLTSGKARKIAAALSLGFRPSPFAITRSPVPHTMTGTFHARRVRIGYGFSYVCDEMMDHRPLTISIKLNAKPPGFARIDPRIPLAGRRAKSGYRGFDAWIHVTGSSAAFVKRLQAHEPTRATIKSLVSPTWGYTSQLSVTKAGYLHLRSRSSRLSLKRLKRTLEALSLVADRFEETG